MVSGNFLRKYNSLMTRVSGLDQIFFHSLVNPDLKGIPHRAGPLSCKYFELPFENIFCFQEIFYWAGLSNGCGLSRRLKAAKVISIGFHAKFSSKSPAGM